MTADRRPGAVAPVGAGQEPSAAAPLGASQELGTATPMTAPRQAASPRGLARFAVSGEQLLFWLLLALWVLNVADLLLTHYVLWLGFATEENGVMRYFLHEGTITATVFKIGIVSVGALLLWRVRHRPAALVAAVLLAAVFAAVVAYQAAWAISL
ncbi:MAG TPA: DUF5658 family protein [Thermoleophilia bacterium]|nr:DUF5658 family protein [Thermoleophilia bacterium]